MARKRKNKPSRHKPPTVNQRLRADARQGSAQRKGASGPLKVPISDVRIDKAQAAWQRGLFEEAIWFYERALARDPHNPILLVDVARAYALRYRFADAEKLINLATALHPDDARLQRMLGHSYQQLQQFDRAIDCFSRSLAIDPGSPDRSQILVELAKMHERLHDLGIARQHATEAMSLAPKFHLAHYVLANIERRAGETETAESRWKQLIEQHGVSRGVVADSWYQLAALYDKSGRFDEAYDALTRAKNIFGEAATPYRDEAWTISRAAGRSLAAFNSEFAERWMAAGATLAPLGNNLAILTSHPRSGTTLLEQVLDSHPAAISADEIQVLSDLVYIPLGQKANSTDPVPDVLDRTPLDDLNHARLAYVKGMEGALREPINGRLLIDKNPEMTMLLPVIARVFPEMQVLFALRDPRDVVISCFSQQLPLNPVSVHYLTLEDTAKKYVKTMQAWLKLRGVLRNPWIEIRYEDMVADLEAQSRKALEFLGLPWNDCVLEYHQRAQKKHVHSPTYEAVTKPVYSSSIGRWRNYAEQLEPYQEMLQPFVDAFGYA
jgi:tetratricopeptide (TPR) repeat protein